MRVSTERATLILPPLCTHPLDAVETEWWMAYEILRRTQAMKIKSFWGIAWVMVFFVQSGVESFLSYVMKCEI